MRPSLELRKPENWQDFESLCKILWGEIWNCNEVKKNGSSGQTQNGVDIYAKPFKEHGYFGIQCKKKKSSIKLTIKEIDEEITKAKDFRPSLTKLYIATTANKDAAIEEYVRIRDLESTTNGGFEIHLFCWEDIVDLIDENRRTHDWYLNKLGFRKGHKCEILFSGNSQILHFKPKILKCNAICNQYYIPPKTWLYRDPYNPFRDAKKLDPQPISHYLGGSSINHSSCQFSFMITNIGSDVIENFKMKISIPVEDVSASVVDKSPSFVSPIHYTYNIWETQTPGEFWYEPKESCLVQKEHLVSDRLCLVPLKLEPIELTVTYHFLAKDFDIKGDLKIIINPEIIENDFDFSPTDFKNIPEPKFVITNYTVNKN